MVQDNNKMGRVILREDDQGGNNYEMWEAGIRADEITIFQENAIYLNEPSQRDEWMKEVFENPAPKKTAFTFQSPVKYDRSPYQTPTKAAADNPYEQQSIECRNMIRMACTRLTEAISHEIIQAMSMGTESPWMRAFKANRYDTMKSIIKQQYCINIIYPHQLYGQTMETIYNTKCEDMAVLNYFKRQETEYYTILRIYADTKKWKEIEKLEIFITKTVIAAILQGCIHPTMREEVQKAYSTNKVPNNMQDTRTFLEKIQKNWSEITPQVERNHVTKTIQTRGQKRRISEEAKTSPGNKRTNFKSAYVETRFSQPDPDEPTRKMCHEFWSGTCNNKTCNQSHDPKDRKPCWRDATTQGCPFGENCIFQHKSKTKIPINAKQGNKNVAKNRKEANNITTEGYNPRNEINQEDIKLYTDMNNEEKAAHHIKSAHKLYTERNFMTRLEKRRGAESDESEEEEEYTDEDEYQRT